MSFKETGAGVDDEYLAQPFAPQGDQSSAVQHHAVFDDVGVGGQRIRSRAAVKGDRAPRGQSGGERVAGATLRRAITHHRIGRRGPQQPHRQ